MINIKVCKEAYSESGRVVQIDNDGTVVITSIRTSVGMKQTGSGTPSSSNKRPIVRWNNVVTHRSETEGDAGVEYTTDLGIDGITAFEIDVIKGEVTVTGGFIESYNGETLTGEWLSDRDAYVSGSTPSIGAQVAYELAQPYSFAVTPQIVSLVDGTNYLWVVANGKTVRDDAYDGESVSFVTTDTTVLTDFDIEFAPKQDGTPSWHTETDDVVSFENTDGATSIKSVIAPFEPIQDGTPWQSSLMQVPYISKPCPDLDHDYNSEFDSIVGGSVAWNQLVQNGNFADGMTKWLIHTGTVASVIDGVLQFDATSSHGIYQTNKPIVIGHKYLQIVSMRASVTGINALIITNNPSSEATKIVTNIPTSFVTYTQILTGASTGNGIVQVRGSNTVTDGLVYLDDIMLIDLTALFGSATIADYLYSLEQTTAGSGIAKLKEWGFDIDSYHAYDTGSLQSVNVSEHNTVGKNLYVGSPSFSGYLNYSNWTLDSQQYQGHEVMYKNNAWGGLKKVIWLDEGTYTFSVMAKANVSTIAWMFMIDTNAYPYTTATVPHNQGTVSLAQNEWRKVSFTFTVTKAGTVDPRIELASNNTLYISEYQLEYGSTATDYEPYTKQSYALDSRFELRGIPKLDSNNNLYYDGDVYESSGAVSRKYGIVDLGTLDWSKSGSAIQGRNRFISDAISNIPHPSNNYTLKCICSRYYGATTADWLYNHDTDKSIAVGAGANLIIVDSALNDGDATAFKTAMSGVYLVYELATPTTETADPYTAIQTVDPYGTEEYIDYSVSQGTRDIAVPVGHKSVYADIVPINGWDEINVYRDSKYGGLINWNQLVQNGNFADSSNWGHGGNASFSISDGECVLTIGSQPWNQDLRQTTDAVAGRNGHKVFMGYDYKMSSDLSAASVYCGVQAVQSNVRRSYSATYTRAEGIIQYDADGQGLIRIGLYDWNHDGIYQGGKIYLKNIVIFDLTQMFGETKANEIYAMEQAETGSGVAYFKSLFPNDYYEYNTGTTTTVDAVNGDTSGIYLIDLDGTRYGGTVDAVSGKMTVTMAEVDLGSLNYTYRSGFAVSRFDYDVALEGIKKPSSNFQKINGICSIYEIGAANSETNKTICVNTAGYLRIYDSAYTDATEFKYAMNGIKLVYELATPLVIQLTPTQIDALIGSNYIWVDSGDVTVTYASEYPISGWDWLHAYVSPTEDIADADVYNIYLDGTRYGGTLDVQSGVLTVTMVETDLGSLNWTKLSEDANGQLWRTSVNGLKTEVAASIPVNAISNLFKAVRRNIPTLHPGDFCYYNSTFADLVFVTMPGLYANSTECKAGMSGVQLAYELAEPIEVQLTPTEVRLLLGTNYVWSDEDNIVHVKTRTFGTDIANESIDVDYNTTVQYDGIMCGNGIVPDVKM